jgi:bifunctional ADP-heptose synthase (sugar kinase/adenylyltransferase)
VDALAGRRVAVIGDLIADEFIYGEIARVSREAPVLILNYDSTEIVPGGAGNAAGNVASLGGAARLAGLAGRDETGRRLLATLKKRRIDVAPVARPAGYRTPTKTRILAGGIHSAKQQVVRIDRAAANTADEAAKAAFRSRVLHAVRGCDALLVSDYGTGLVTPKLIAEAAQIFRLKAEATGRRRRRDLGHSRLDGGRSRPDSGNSHSNSGRSRRDSGSSRSNFGSIRLQAEGPILIDSRYDLLKYRGMTACTPNESEVEQALGIRIGDNARTLERAGRELLRRTRSEAVLITRGSRGMALFQAAQPTVHIPIFGSDQIADVTGAGDTVIATMTLALSAGASFEDAARLANRAGGLVVMKRGTATVSASELRYAISRGAVGRPAGAPGSA